MKIKNKWFNVLLAGSLALNLAFVATFAVRYFSQPPVKSVDFDTNLELSTDQKKQIDTITEGFKVSMVDYKHQMLEKRMDIIDELGDPEFNLDRVNGQVVELNELEKNLNIVFVDALVSITNILDSKQRIAFLYKLSRNWFFRDRTGKRGPQ